nr:unnamed protein product [Callosobruchus analis]
MQIIYFQILTYIPSKMAHLHTVAGMLGNFWVPWSYNDGLAEGVQLSGQQDHPT